MKEYNSIQLDDMEVQALNDIEQLTGRIVNSLAFLGDIEISETESYDFYSEVFWYEDNHVVGLYLRESSLKKLPKSIGYLSDLRYLGIFETKIQKLPSTLRFLKKLEEIVIFYDPVEFANFFLELPDIFQNLTGLKRFSILGLFFIYTPPSLFKSSSLTELSLECCFFFTDYTNFAKFNYEKKEQFEYNKLPNDLSYFESLNRLTLKDMKDVEFPSPIKTSLSLKELELNNLLNATNLDSCFTIKSLEILFLKSCELKKIPNTIGNLENLRSLSIYDNHVQDLPPEIANCKNLQELNISRNGFVKVLTILMSVKNLRTVVVDKHKLNIIPEEISHLVNPF